MTGLFNLTHRQTRLALDLLLAAVVISVAFAMANLTWRIAGHAGTGAITVPSGGSAPAGGSDIAASVALFPFGRSATADASNATTLPLELKGIIAANPASLSTAFIALSGQPATPFQIGQNVGGGTIRAIQRDRVILDNAGRAEYLGFPDPTQDPGAAAAPAGNALAPGAQSGTNAPAPSPPAPSADSAQSVAPLLERLGASQVDGGYRVGASGIPGLNAGDVLMSVNGTALSDPTAAGAAFTAARASGSATLQVLRDGKRMTLTVPLR